MADCICASGYAHKALNASATLSLFVKHDKAGSLELSQVIVDLLPGKSKPPRESRCRIGFSQARQQLPSNRREHSGDSLRRGDDIDVLPCGCSCHNAGQYIIDKNICQ